MAACAQPWRPAVVRGPASTPPGAASSPRLASPLPRLRRPARARAAPCPGALASARPGEPPARRPARALLPPGPVPLPRPWQPDLAGYGNPVFFVADDRVLCCGLGMLHFFMRDSPFQPADRAVVSSSSPFSAGASRPSCTRRSLDVVQASRWIEFWSDAASDRCHRDSSSLEASTASSSSSSLGCSSPPWRPTPRWVDSYLDELGSMLKKGGWRDREVDEMVEGTASGFLDDGEEAPTPNSKAILDAL
ncbi:hypothetical protein ZEAMMB73_Zm00001d004454, partial [Zea mays]